MAQILSVLRETAEVEFLKSFCECEPHYRALFVKKEVGCPSCLDLG